MANSLLAHSLHDLGGTCDYDFLVRGGLARPRRIGQRRRVWRARRSRRGGAG
jgi:hypothetical protein